MNNSPIHILNNTISIINRFKDFMIQENNKEFNRNLLDLHHQLSIIVKDKFNHILKPFYLISVAYLLILFQENINLDYYESLKNYFSKHYPTHIKYINENFIDSLVRFKKMVNIKTALADMNIDKDLYNQIKYFLKIN